MKTETWHNRLDHALKARGKSWADLIDATGLKKPSVYAWKPTATKRTTIMDGGNSAIVCSYLGINPMWLFHGKGASGLDDDLQQNDCDLINEIVELAGMMKEREKIELIVRAKDIIKERPIQSKQAA